MNELFLWVRPPRPLWPFNGPGSAVWPPLAFASLAAALREGLSNLRVEILDAPALEMGWQSLTRELQRRRPVYVGIGEEAVSCVEGVRLSRLAREAGARIIAGGCFFSHVAGPALRDGLADIVVHGEGEITAVEVVQALREPGTSALHRVRGISFRDGDTVIQTPPRPLIEDLDHLPMPAYDLLPVERYGRQSRHHPRLAAIEASRGCHGACDFCVLWRQMGRREANETTPRRRVKSPERLLEEICRLQDQHGRRYLGWVDPCFNADAQTPAQLAELMLQRGMRIGQSAWMRVDALARDAASGALRLCVQAGLDEAYLGLERGDADSLQSLGKSLTPLASRETLERVAREFPEIFLVGSFIYGLPGDTPDTVRALHQMTMNLPLDYAFFIPLTPLPGTPYWREETDWDSTGELYRTFSFLPTPARPGEDASLHRAMVCSLAFDWRWARLRGYWRGLTRRPGRQREMLLRLAWRGGLYQGRWLRDWLLGRPSLGGMIKPKWYED